MIAWCHDLSWTNPLYLPFMHEGFPWSLLREPAPNTTYVTISEERRRQLLDLWGERDHRVTVIPNGIDAHAFWRLTPAIREIVDRFRLLDRDIVLLLPVRITRRKNIEAAIRTVRCLTDRGLDVIFLVSGPQAPHHPGLSDTYLGELKALRAALGVEEQVIFLADSLGHNLETEAVADLYAVADVLLFPSAQEGFGIPILEAGLARVPIVLSDIPIFHEVGGGDVTVFGLDEPPESVANRLIAALDTPSSRLYRRVLREYRWDAIVDRQIIPLLRREPIPADAPEASPDEAAIDEGAAR
jgi:glycosyltransferase involved in cell wall biosynthesis